jgi:rhamnosyltransferase
VTRSPAASIIIRAKNKAKTIEETFRTLARQTVPLEVIVIDSGSTDGTVDIARRHADQVLEIPPHTFSYGGTLNMGSRIARADIHFSLSAHGTALKETWVEECLRHYDDPLVAATTGYGIGPNGARLTSPYRPSLDEALTDCGWGYSNHAGSWRASVLREHPFREDLPACEDKEWFWRVLAAGWHVVIDPALVVPSDHRRAAGLRALWGRQYREGYAFAVLGRPVTSGLGDSVRGWLTDFRQDSPWPRALRPLSPFRAVEYWGNYFGTLAGRRNGPWRSIPSDADEWRPPRSPSAR